MESGVIKKDVKNIEEVLEVLETQCVDWITVNKIENSLCEQGVAFFDRGYRRVAYYDEVHNVLSVN